MFFIVITIIVFFKNFLEFINIIVNYIYKYNGCTYIQDCITKSKLNNLKEYLIVYLYKIQNYRFILTIYSSYSKFKSNNINLLDINFLKLNNKPYFNKSNKNINKIFKCYTLKCFNILKFLNWNYDDSIIICNIPIILYILRNDINKNFYIIFKLNAIINKKILNLVHKQVYLFNKIVFTSHFNKLNIENKDYRFISDTKIVIKLFNKFYTIEKKFNKLNINSKLNSYINKTYIISYSPTNIIKYINNFWYLSININFLRKNKIFNKGRYSRNRQTYKTGVYWCLYINIIAVISFYFWFYKFTINFSYNYWFIYIFIILFFFIRSLKYKFYNLNYIKTEYKLYILWLNSLMISFFNILYYWCTKKLNNIVLIIYIGLSDIKIIYIIYKNISYIRLYLYDIYDSL